MSSAFAALRHRNFRIFLIGQFISLSGTWVQSVAQSWLLYRLTKSELILGLAAFATHIPVLLFGAIGGVAADRFDRRKIVITTQCLFLIQAALLAWLTFTGQVEVWHVLGLAFLFGVVNAFDVPSRQSLLIHMADRTDLLSAISLNSAAFNTARAVGPSLGGIVVAAVGEGICFALNAGSFLCVLVSLLMSIAAHRKSTPCRSLRSPARWISLRVDASPNSSRSRAVWGRNHVQRSAAGSGAILC